MYATTKYSSGALCHRKCKFELYAKDAAGCRQWAVSEPHMSVGRGKSPSSSTTAALLPPAHAVVKRPLIRGD
jgi:hypothetical protein